LCSCLKKRNQVPRLIASKAQQCWLQEASSRPTFAQLSQQLEYSYAQLQTELGSRQAAVDAGDGRADVFISFRFGEAHAEALALKTALEQLKLKVFLSSVSPGGDLQDAISAALANCRAAVILATKTYGAKTNGLFDTSNEMNFVVGERKPYYLVRMIPMDETWVQLLSQRLCVCPALFSVHLREAWTTVMRRDPSSLRR